MGGRLEVISGWRDSFAFSDLVVDDVVASKDVSLLAVLETEKSCNMNIERERNKRRIVGGHISTNCYKLDRVGVVIIINLGIDQAK